MSLSSARPSLIDHDPALFREVSEHAADTYGMSVDKIVCDYWLVRFLHKWQTVITDSHIRRAYPDPKGAEDQYVGSVVFGGGTSLTAAWQITQRWSEDVDLLLNPLPESKPKHLRSACQAAAMTISNRIGRSLVEHSRGKDHYFFAAVDKATGTTTEVDVVFRQIERPMWVEKVPVMSMIGRVSESGLLAEFPELGGFKFNTLGPGSTAMNKLLAQTEACASGDITRIAERARDLYDLACIALHADEFEGHLGRDSKALLWIAEQWIDTSERKRPPDGFVSLPSFDPKTREYEALAAGYEEVLSSMVWGEQISLQEAIALATTLDPGPAELSHQPKHGRGIAYP